MKNNYIKLLGLFSFILLFAACEYEGIDPITPVEPGADAADPEVTISSPIEGATINVLEEVSSINIKFEVRDDIEVANIEVAVDGNTVATMNEFLDYRIVKDEVVFDNVTNGEHTVTVTATDMDGNTTTKTVNFSKEPPYTPKYDALGEYTYMPFDGAYIDLMTLTEAEVVGDPGFTNDSFLGTAAYQGATDAYLKLPFDGSVGQEFTASFWYKFNSTPDRAGILVVGPEDTANPDAQNDRSSGFRLFRELVQGVPTIKLSIGTGDAGGEWNNGSSIEAYEGEWMHVAFSVTPTETKMYFNGQLVNEAGLTKPIDWTGASFMSIMSGAPRFTGWNHLSDLSSMDELRIFDTALSQSDIQMLINSSAETLYMPFDGAYKDLASNRDVTVVGDPGFAGESVVGSDAYAGAADAYLTLPADGLTSQEFSGTFWYKLNADPNRAGILVIAPEDTENPDSQNLRTSGFRLFREADGDKQRIKLHVGNSIEDNWNNGGLVDPAVDEWVHVAFTIAGNESKIYLDGELVSTASISGDGISWENANLLSIMSGAPRFTGWNHLSDKSFMDELRLYNKELTQDEIQAMLD